jgi:hypothetical protein
VGQDCILQAGFSTGLLRLSATPQRAPMKSALQLENLPHSQVANKLKHVPQNICDNIGPQDD